MRRLSLGRAATCGEQANSSFQGDNPIFEILCFLKYFLNVNEWFSVVLHDVVQDKRAFYKVERGL